MRPRLEGKVAFITGAAQGIGRAHAARLAQEGADIIAADIADLSTTAGVVESAGRRIISRLADVRDLTALTELVAYGVRELGRLDVVVANAAIIAPAPALETTGDTWQTTIDVNLTGAWNTCRAALPHLLDRGGGSIVIVSSILGLRPTPGVLAYSVSKHGLVGLMRALAVELAPQNVRVNSVHPTTVDTPMLRALWPEGMDESEVREALTPSNALPVPWVDAEDVAAAVAFLASDDARYVTGVALPVDAGSLLLS